MTKSDPAKRTAEEQALLLEKLTDVFNRQIRFNEYLGLRIQRLEPQPVQIGFTMRDEFIGHFLYGRLHGGVISSVLDVVGGLAVMIALSEQHRDETMQQVLQRFAPLATLDMRVDFLREGVGRQFCAQGEIVRLGRRVAVCRMELHNEHQTLIATGNASYMVS